MADPVSIPATRVLSIVWRLRHMMSLSYFKMVAYERGQYRELELKSRQVERGLTALCRDAPDSPAANCPMLYPAKVYGEHQDSVGKLHHYMKELERSLAMFGWSDSDISKLPTLKAKKGTFWKLATAGDCMRMLEGDREILERLANNGPLRHVERRLRMVDKWHSSISPEPMGF
jgi:hypothetical protein